MGKTWLAQPADPLSQRERQPHLWNSQVPTGKALRCAAAHRAIPRAGRCPMSDIIQRHSIDTLGTRCSSAAVSARFPISI
ncbi:MAG: hypothetical protein JWN85_2885 [Gammaproteobacteria bacterium]|nr:hypothetical protein [Gammaproteobacteria bacterium]